MTVAFSGPTKIGTPFLYIMRQLAETAFLSDT